MDFDKLIIPIGTLAGVIVGGFITSLTIYFQLKSQNTRETKKLKLSKLETAHEEISKIRKAYSFSTFALSLYPFDRKEAARQISENKEFRFIVV